MKTELRIADIIRHMARNGEGIQNIVVEEATAYFAGDKTADEIVKIIESRVRTYVAE